MVDENAATWAVRTVKLGLSANEGFRQLQEAGLGVRRATWLRLVSEARLQLATKILAIDVTLSLRPAGNQITAMTTTTGSGYLQQVDVWVRDRSTGLVGTRPYSLATDVLMTHGDAIATAIDKFTDNASQYDEQVLGATYAGTYLMIPGGFE